MSIKKKILKSISVFAGICAALAVLAVVFLPLPGTIPILMYHFVGTEEQASEHKNFVSEKSFTRQMGLLKLLNFKVISLDELDGIRSGKIEPKGKQVVLTFDDGNYSFASKALPILQKHDFPVAVFVVSESVKRELHGSMDEETVKSIAALGNVTIGSHSKTHPLLSRMSDDEIFDELKGSKEALEAILGAPVHYLAYPNGDIDARVLEVAAETGYRLAFITSYKKLNGLREGLHSLARVKITRTSDNPLVFWVKLSGIYQTFKKHRQRLKHTQL